MRNFRAVSPFHPGMGSVAERTQLWRRTCVVGAIAWMVLAVSATGAGATTAPRWAWSPPRLVDHRAPLGARYELDGVSCTSRSLCVAVGDYGSIEWSTDPAAGAASWQAAEIDKAADTPENPTNVNAVSCASPSVCVAVDAHGNALISRDPAAGARSWRATQIDRGGQLTAVSCPSPGLCVTGDSSGRVFSSRHPSATGSSWRRTRLPAALTSVSCPSAALCVGTDRAGDVVSSTDPGDSRPRWRVTPVVGKLGLTISYRPEVSCPSASLCVAAIGTEVLVSTDPAGDASAWRLTYRIPGFTPVGFGALSCPTTSACVALTTAGGYLESADPAGGQTAWGGERLGPVGKLDPAGAHVEIACVSRSLCVAVNGVQVVTSTTPLAAVPAWAIGTPRGGYNSVGGLQCPGRRLCVGFDNAGNVLTSTHPADGAHSWSLAHVDSRPIVKLVCPSSTLCVAFDARGGLLSTRDPARGRAAWRHSSLAGVSTQPADLICPSTRLCVAIAGGRGEVYVSTDPAGGAQHWMAQTIDTTALPCGGNHPDPPGTCPADLTAIACPDRSLCVAVDSLGNAVISTDPAGGAGTWRTQPIDPDANPDQQYDPLQFIACPSRSLCAAADFIGNIITTQTPAGGAPWRVAPVDSAYGFLADFTCPSPAMCLGITNNKLFASRRPGGPAPAWRNFSIHIPPLSPEDDAGEITCLSTRFCAAQDGGPEISISTDPARGTVAWRAARADPRTITALACASPSLCVAADNQGYLTTGAPVGRSRARHR